MRRSAGRFVIGACALVVLGTAGAATAEVDLSAPEHTGVPAPPVLPFQGLDGAGADYGVLDDFNRPDGPLGSGWTVQAGSFAIVSQTARGSSSGLATHNNATGDVVEMDVAVDGIGTLHYAAAVLNYGAGSTNLFIKVQGQASTDFTHGACYTGNNDTSAPFGLGFFSLTQPFASAHMRVEVDATRKVTIDFTNINGGALPDQRYVCTGAPPPEGPAIGIGGFDGHDGIDNFAIGSTVPQVRTFNVPSGVALPSGIDHNGFGQLIATDVGAPETLFGMDITSPTANFTFGPVEISLYSGNPVGVTHDTVSAYITDTDDSDVDRFTASGTYLDSFSVAGSTSFPEGIAWCPLNNHLYIVNGDPGNEYVHEYTTAGVHVADYPIPGSSPDGLAWDPNRECFWLYDSGTDSIRQFTTMFTQMRRDQAGITAGSFRGEGVAVIGNALYVVVAGAGAVAEFDILDARSAEGFLFSDGFEWNNLSGWDTSSP